jgi:hypothetical protein
MITADTIQGMKDEASRRFDSLKSESQSLASRQEYVADELLKLQGEYRAYDAMQAQLDQTPIGELAEAAPVSSEATRIEVKDGSEDEQPTAE